MSAEKDAAPAIECDGTYEVVEIHRERGNGIGEWVFTARLRHGSGAADIEVEIKPAFETQALAMFHERTRVAVTLTEWKPPVRKVTT